MQLDTHKIMSTHGKEVEACNGLNAQHESETTTYKQIQKILLQIRIEKTKLNTQLLAKEATCGKCNMQLVQ